MTAHSCGSLFTLLFLLVLFPCDEDGIASEAPVVEVYFVDDDDGAGRVLVKNIDEKVTLPSFVILMLTYGIVCLLPLEEKRKCSAFILS